MAIFCHNLSHYTLPTPGPSPVGISSCFFVAPCHHDSSKQELSQSWYPQAGWMVFFWESWWIFSLGVLQCWDIFWGDNQSGLGVGVVTLWMADAEVELTRCFLCNQKGGRKGANLMSVCWLRDVYERKIMKYIICIYIYILLGRVWRISRCDMCY